MSERKQFEMMALGAKDAFLKVSDEATFSKEIMYALQILRGSSYLQRCAPNTIKNAITNIALTGATLNPALQQAFLVPRNIMVDGKKVMSCCLDFSYRGLIKIATDTGSVIDIDATIVNDGDDFYYEKGLNPVLKHVPINKTNKITHVYVIATLHNGDKKFDVMTKDEIDKIRKTSQCPDSPAWKNFEGEMAKKTIIKRFYKTLPQTDRMSEAIHTLNQHEGLEVAKKGDKGKDVLNRFDVAGAEEAEYTDMNEEHQEQKPSEKPAEKEESKEAAETDKKDTAKPKGSASPAQIKKIQTVMSKMGLKTEDEQLDWISFNFEIQIPAVDGLSKDQANKIIKALENKNG